MAQIFRYMKKLAFYTTVMVWSFLPLNVLAQSENDPGSAQGQSLKEEVAEKHPRNSDNRVAIFENEDSLMERNSEEEVEKHQRKTLRITWGNDKSCEKEKEVFADSVTDKNKRILYDRRTTSGPMLAFGLNNVITEGSSLDDSDFKVAGSRFFEIGWVWKTRIIKNSNFLRIKYGLSFQFNGLKPTDNRIFVDTGEQTELESYPLHLDKSKFRMDHLVVPVHFEFGPSHKTEYKDHFRYSAYDAFKVGIGGYAGINLGTMQKLKFTEDGEKQKHKMKSNYNTQNFVYGVSAYIGWGSGSVYAKYNLNPIFKDNAVEQRNISLGLRIDLD